MGLFERITSIFRRSSEPDDDGREPQELMEVSLERSQEVLATLGRAMADVTAGRLRLDMQIQKLTGVAGTLETHAREALQAGREDLARSALARRAGVQAQIDQIASQRAALVAEHGKMALTEQKLEARIEAFRTQKDTIQAQYSAAEAQVKVGEAVSGLSEDMADMGAAAAKAEDRLQTMQARAEAIDELLASGSLEDLSGGDAVDAEIARTDAAGDLDAELERLRAEIGGAPGQTTTGGAR